MKKLLVCCGVVFLLLVLVLGYFGYKGASFVMGTAKEFEAIGRRIEALNAAHPFTAREGQLLDGERLDAWLNVTRQNEADSQKLVEQLNGKERVGWEEINLAQNQMFDLLRAHIRKLEEARMSPAEYGWIHNQIDATLRSQEAAQHPDLASVAQLYQNMQSKQNAASVAPMANPNEEQIQHNLDLIAERRDTMLPMLETIASGGFSGLAEWGRIPAAQPTPQQ